MPKRKHKLKPWDVTKRPVYWFRPQANPCQCDRCHSYINRHDLAAEGVKERICAACFAESA